MSANVVDWVLEHSREKGTHKLVEVILATHAHRDGTSARPSIPTIARKANIDPRTAQRILRDLQAREAIEATGIEPMRGVTIYAIVMDVARRKPPARRRGVTRVSPGGDVSVTRTKRRTPTTLSNDSVLENVGVEDVTSTTDVEVQASYVDLAREEGAEEADSGAIGGALAIGGYDFDPDAEDVPW